MSTSVIVIFSAFDDDTGWGALDILKSIDEAFVNTDQETNLIK